jgi:hypothetical protein
MEQEAVIRESIRLMADCMQQAIKHQDWGSVRVNAGHCEKLDWELRDILNAKRTPLKMKPSIRIAEPDGFDPIPEPEGVYPR